MDASARLEELIKQLNETPNSFARAMGLDRATRIYNVLHRKNGLSRKMTGMITGAYPNVNADWLLTGEGEMFLEESKEQEKKTPQGTHIIRYYDAEASASPIEMFNDQSRLAYQDLCVPGFNDCNIALNVWGDSMEPVLKSGEIILLKRWQESFIEYGYIYLIITKTNHKMIKYLQPSDSDEFVSCESENTFYKPFKLNKRDIVELYVVKGHLERSAI